MSTKLCKVKACDRGHYGRGWCKMHYLSWWKSGIEPTKPLERRRDRTLRERLEQRVVVGPSGCWEWQGSKGPTGYGHMWWSDRLWPVHRLSHVEYIGPIPEGFDVHHHCRNRGCLNPEHLEAMTHSSNVGRNARFIVCQEEGCERKHRARGMCMKHYQRWNYQRKKEDK